MASLFNSFNAKGATIDAKAAKVFSRWSVKIIAVFTLLFAPFAVKEAVAQNDVQITISVLPPYSAYLQDYAGAGKQVQVFVRNTTATQKQVRLLGSVTGDNGVIIQTLPNYRPPQPLVLAPFQNRLLTYADLSGLFDLNQIDVQGVDKNNLNKGLPLPEGSYQLCIRAFDNATSAPLSPDNPLGCSPPFPIKAVEPPILIAPLCDAQVPVQTPQNIVFTWTPPVGVSPATVDYTLRIVELPLETVDPNVFIDAVVLPKSGLEVKNLKTSTFLYTVVHPPLVPGKKYAWRVQARDLSGKTNFLNDGKSPVCAFTYGEPTIAPIDPLAQQANPLVATCSCKFALTGDKKKVDNKPALAAGKAKAAGFEITFLKTTDGVTEDAQGMLNGVGTVPMPIVNYPNFKLRVQLVNVQCNAAGEVIGGYVQAKRNGGFASFYPNYSKPGLKPPSLPTLSLANADSIGTKVQDLGKQLAETPGQLLSKAGDVAKSVGIEVPFGIDKQFGPVSTNIAITDVIFGPEDAYFNASSLVEAPGLTSQFSGIPLAAYHVCIKPGETCGDKVLYLAKDMLATSMLTLRGGATTQKDAADKITHAVFDEKGFKLLHVAGGVKPPGMRTYVPDAPLEMDVKFDLTYDATTTGFNSWSAQVSSDLDFYVDKLGQDFRMSMRNEKNEVVPAIYDCDDARNPGTMPADYEPGKTPTWHGLYLPFLSVQLPLLKSLRDGQNLPVVVKNMIHDGNGFTGMATAGDPKKPLIKLGDGSLGGWYCSTDQLSFTFVQSSFVAGGLDGQVVMPIFKYADSLNASKPSVWPWHCTYTKANNAFEFVVSPKESAHVAIWKADLTINKVGKANPANVTSISATYNDTNGFNARALLNMTLSLNTGVLIAPNMSVEGLSFQTNPGPGESAFDPGQFSAGLNSPQRYIGGDDEKSGLPLELKSVSVGKAKTQESKNGVDFDINLTGGLTLTKISSISALATGFVRFRVAKTAEGRPDWGYVRTGVTSASVNGVMGPVTFNGDLELFGYDGAENDNYGKGLKAKLKATVLGAGGLELQGYFGSKGDAQGRFRYWQIGGLYTLPGPGVPIAPAVNLRAFGGGGFYNMKMKLDTTAKGAPTGEPTFIPARNNCGFQAAVGVTSADGTAIALTGRLTVDLTNCGGDGEIGIGQVALDVNAQLLSGDKPLAEGRAILAVTFTDNKPVLITGNGVLTANYGAGPFYANGFGTMGLHIDLVNGDNFYFYLGKPTQNDNDRVTIKIGAKADNKTLFEADFGTYFFIGKASLAGGIDKLPPDPYKVDKNLLQELGYVGGGQVPDDALAFGAGLHVGFDDTFGPFYLSFQANLGFDLALRNGLYCAGDPSADPNSPAAKSYEAGVNGWYANGQIYASLDLELGIDVDLWIFSGRVQALKITAAALLEGGMVNPVWMHGSVLLKYRVLGGRIKGKVQADFWFQREYRCVVAVQQPNPFAKMPIVSRVLPSGKETVPVITPLYAEFNYPIRALIEINNIDEKGNALDTYRTFKLDFAPNQLFAVALKNGPKGGQGAVCETNNKGRVELDQSADSEFDQSSYNATFYREAALAAQSAYSLTVGIQVYISNKDCTTNPVANCGSKLDNQWSEYLFAAKGKDGKMGSPESVHDKLTVEFTTGECASSLVKEGKNANVSYSFPFEGQRYFTVGDAKTGFVELEAYLCCGSKLTSDANFDLNVRFVPLAGGGFNSDNALFATNVNFDGLRFTYALPAGLKKQQLYRLDIVRIPNDNFVNAQLAALEKMKASQGLQATMKALGTGKLTYAGQLDGGAPAGGKPGNGPSVNALSASTKPGAGLGPQAASINSQANGYVNQYISGVLKMQTQPGLLTSKVTSVTEVLTNNMTAKVTISPAEQKENLKKKYEQIVYSYPFQTSRYSTLQEKLVDTKLMTNDVVVSQSIVLGMLPDAVFTVPMQAREGFDTYELDWAHIGSMGKVRPPLVLLLPSDKGNTWFDGFVKPMLGLVNKIAQKTEPGGKHIFTKDNAQLDEVLMSPLRRRFMSFNWIFDQPQPPITKAELLKL